MRSASSSVVNCFAFRVVVCVLALLSLVDGRAYGQNPPPGFTASCYPNPLYYQTSNTCRVRVPGGATGTVAMFANGDLLTTFTLDSSGNAGGNNLLTNVYPEGAYDLHFVYQPDSNSKYTTTGIDIAQTVYDGQIMVTAETLTCSPQVLYAGNTATCTFHIPNPGSDGKVTFSDGINKPQTVAVDSNGLAHASGLFAGFSPGTYKLSASYAGDHNDVAFQTTSAENILSAKPLPLAMTVGCLPSSITVGASGSCQVEVSGGATGTVDLSVNGATVKSQVTLVNGAATISGLFSTLPAGAAAVGATYNGDANFAPATAGTSVNVSSGTSTTAISVSCNPQNLTVNQTTICTAQLNPGATGTVQFERDGRLWGSKIALDANAAASQTWFNPATTGSHVVQAIYSGDGNFPASTGATPVNIDSTASDTATVTLSCAPATVVAGQSTNCTAHVSGNATGGVILYYNDSIAQGIGLDTSGNAIFQHVLAGYGAGAYHLSAHYLGDLNYTGQSGAATDVQVVDQAPATNMTASVTPSTVQSGGQVSLSVTVAPGATQPAIVSLNNQVLTELNLDGNGAASALLAFTDPGTYNFIVSYPGDGNIAAASYPVTLSVTATPPTSPATGSMLYSYSITKSDNTSGYAPNGDVLAYTDSVNGQWTASYDTLNRIVSASQTPSSSTGSNVTGQYLCWVYDSFGNRVLQARAPGALNQCTASSMNGENYVQGVFNTSNQLTAVYGEAVWQGSNNTSGWQIVTDSSGNVTTDPVNNYWYDGEGRVCAAQNTISGPITGYLYDAEGQRTAKGTITPLAGSDYCDLTTNNFVLTNEYIPGPNGGQLTEVLWDKNVSTPAHTNAYANGQLVATFTYDASGSSNTLHFSLNDWLGTRRLQTDAAGNPEKSCSGGSFGDDLDCISLSDTAIEDATGPTETHFTGKEHDQETRLDYFGARYYASSMGRWMSPDYSMNSVILELPQSWNKYSYVLNRPLYASDPDGRCPWCVGAVVGGVVEGGFDLGKQLYNNGGSLSKVSWGEVGANALGGAVAGAVAVGTGGLSLVGSSVADGIIGNTVGNVVGGVVTRAADPNTSGDDVLSAGEVAQDAVSGFVGGTAGTLAGEVVHVPDEPVRPDPRHQARTSVYNARMQARNQAIISQGIRGGVTGSAVTHSSNGAMGLVNRLWNWLLFSPPPSNPHPNEHVTVTIHFDPNQQPQQ